MDIGHSEIIKILTKWWEKHAVEMSAFETLALIDWTYNYIKPLKRFGINDIFLINGMNNLCNAYSRKVHS